MCCSSHLTLLFPRYIPKYINLIYLIVKFKNHCRLSILILQWRIQAFPWEGRQPSRGPSILVCQNFPKNCMKLKEFGSAPRETRPWRQMYLANVPVSLPYLGCMLESCWSPVSRRQANTCLRSRKEIPIITP